MSSASDRKEAEEFKASVSGTSDETVDLSREPSSQQTPIYEDIYLDGNIIQGLNPPIRLLERIGRGGEASVYRAEKISSFPTDVAVKVSRTDDASRVALLNEARRTKDLRHHTIIGIQDHHTGRDRDFIVMDFVEGPDAAKVLADHNNLGLQVAPQIPAFTAWAACEGLKVAHKPLYRDGNLVRPGVIHRDINPKNILYHEAGGSPIIADFGIGLPLDENGLIVGGGIGGKVGWIAPELFEDGVSVDARADIYSLGMTMDTMITGSNPLRDSIPSTVDPKTAAAIYRDNQLEGMPLLEERSAGVPSALADIVRKATAFGRNDRYQTASELRKDLTHLYLYPPGVGYSMTREAVHTYLGVIGDLTAQVSETGAPQEKWSEVLGNEREIDLETFNDAVGSLGFLVKKRKVIREERGPNPVEEPYLRLKKLDGGPITLREKGYKVPDKDLGDVE